MYQQRILNYLRRHPVFTTEEIRKGLRIPASRGPTLNVEMKRLCDAGKVVRFKKGVYGAPGTEMEAFVDHLYLESGGYMRGRNALRALGISLRENAASVQEAAEERREDAGAGESGLARGRGTLASDTVVVSNKVARSGTKFGVGMQRPRTEITEDNAAYFRILDQVQDLEAFARDPESAGKAIRAEVNREHLDWARLIALANRYYQKRVIIEVNGYVEEEYA